MISLADRFEHHLDSPSFCYSMLEKHDHGRLSAMFN